MPVLAVASSKGGVGKTTVALNLACSLARRGWKTLVVDSDPQGGIALSVAGAAGRGQGLVACLEQRAPLVRCIVSTNLPTLSLLPASGGDPSATDGTADANLLGQSEPMRRLLAEADAIYDLVIVDTPSGLTGPTDAVLRAANFVLIPLQAEPLALRTMPQILAKVAALRDAGATLAVAGCVLTMMSSKNETSLSVAQESWSKLPAELLLNTFVPRDPVFQRASAHGVPLHLLSRRPPPVAMVFDQLAAEVEDRIGLPVEEHDDGPIALVD